ncbi:hypothetical protein ElyMa_005498700 [Elysia marginata]|uniref:Uncharacterized protein n=1 Tax=Elysia marginata TaxID=1093978 RepID=A0AAV4EU51_9GAST|nr:hypothetical protein ElyMa_005498700 [Elysia marginata]
MLCLKSINGKAPSHLWSPDRRQRRQVSNSSSGTPKAGTATYQNSFISEKKENASPTSHSKSVVSSHGKQNVRLRDLVNIRSSAPCEDRNSHGEEPGKSVGVQLSQEVKVMTADGNQSTAALREDGNVGKMKRTQGKGTGKFVSVIYPEVTTDNPAECKQQ